MATYHGKSGKFCKKDSAQKVSDGGQQYRVVRQKRRIGPDGKEVRASRSSSKKVNETIQHAIAAKQKLAMTGQLSGRGWVNVLDLFEGNND